MNVFEHLMVFSTVVLVSLYLWWQMQTFKIQVGSTQYSVFGGNDTIFVKLSHGASKWYYNPRSLINVTYPTDIRFTVGNRTYDLWYDV